MNTPSLKSWEPDLAREPWVRVGMVLPEDRFETLRVFVKKGSYSIVAMPPNLGTREPESDVSTVDSARELVINRVGDWVCVRGFERESPSSRWEMRPLDPSTGTVVLRGLRAGRGFHWERCCDQEVPGSIEIRSTPDGLLVVATLNLESYLLGVITSEMSGDCPIDLLKAQAVAARSWLLAGTEKKHAELGFDFCNDDCCQRFQGLSEASDAARQAIKQTRGQVLRSADGTIVDANYAKNCGGISEDPVAVWGTHKAGQYAAVDAPPDSPAHKFFPVTDANLDEFLRGQWLSSCDCYCSPQRVPDAVIADYLGRVDDGKGYFRWSVTYDADTLTRLVARRLPESVPSAKMNRVAGMTSNLTNPNEMQPISWDIHAIDELRVTRRGLSGRAVEMAITWFDSKGGRQEQVVTGQYAIRGMLSESFLYSSAFVVDHQRDAQGHLEAVTLHGAGWGHGAGLCQIGALGRALSGQDYGTILHHYFREVRIEAIY